MTSSPGKGRFELEQPKAARDSCVTTEARSRGGAIQHHQNTETHLHPNSSAPSRNKQKHKVKTNEGEEYCALESFYFF